MGVITISREFGSGGETVARMVSERLGFLLINKNSILEGMAGFGITEPVPEMDEKISRAEERRRRYLDALNDYIYDLAIRNNLVILGRGGHILFKDYPPSLHIRITAPLKHRVKRVMEMYNLSPSTAGRLIREQDRNKKQYYRQVFNTRWGNHKDYDLLLNTASVSLENAACLIVTAFNLQGEYGRLLTGEEEYTGMIEHTAEPSEKTGFMHPSEAEFARMLDFYLIRWQYEPKTFILKWDSEGNVMEALTPDFYLPEQDLFIELTTQKQKLAWKKNKKIRRLRELYPHIKIKLINKRGFESLLKKHSLEEDDLSG